MPTKTAPARTKRSRAVPATGPVRSTPPPKATAPPSVTSVPSSTSASTSASTSTSTSVPTSASASAAPSSGPGPQAPDAREDVPDRATSATVRILWALGAAVLGGLTFAFLAVALTLGEAHAALAANSARTGAPTDLSWTAMTDAPYMQTLFHSVWAASGGALFLLLTRPGLRR